VSRAVTEVSVEPTPESPDPHDAAPVDAPVEGADEATTDEPDRLLSPGARAFFDWVLVVGIALFVAILVRTFFLAHSQVEGESMINTLHPGDRVFVNKMSYRLHDPNRGDVVVLHEFQGSGGERDLIKRVIGLPGETIEMSDCVVYIDGLALDEPYLDAQVVTPSNCGADFDPVEVRDDHVYVLGDNRPGSSDSRQLGQISEDDLVGRAFVVFWPKSDWQWL